jgi:hypothetical protein
VIAPGVISGALVAFATSFDEVVVTLFLAGPEQVTLPRQMFTGIRENITPTIAAVATLLILFTTSLLLVLQEWGLLKHHAIDDPKYRGNTLVLQTPHNTAVLVDRATKVEWVVDLWPRGYLQPPDVMTVQKWVTED